MRSVQLESYQDFTMHLNSLSLNVKSLAFVLILSFEVQTFDEATRKINLDS